MSNELHWELGRVESTRIGLERGFALTAWVFFRFGCSGQGFGGHFLHNAIKKRADRVAADETAAGSDYLCRVMRVFGVEEWSDIVGRVAEVGRESHMGPIVAIRQAPCDGDEVFDVREWRREWFGGAE